MSQGDAQRLYANIKEVEQYIGRLRTLRQQAIKEGSSDVFTINREIKTVLTRLNLLIDRYNDLARLSKENREYLIAIAKRDEQIALKNIRMRLNEYRKQQDAKTDE